MVELTAMQQLRATLRAVQQLATNQIQKMRLKRSGGATIKVSHTQQKRPKRMQKPTCGEPTHQAVQQLIYSVESVCQAADVVAGAEDLSQEFKSSTGNSNH